MPSEFGVKIVCLLGAKIDAAMLGRNYCVEGLAPGGLGAEIVGPLGANIDAALVGHNVLKGLRLRNVALELMAH